MPVSEKVLRNIRLTEDENRQLKADAHAHRMNVSEYIRYLIEKEREGQNSDRHTGN
ncbi:MAG: hypothetical protein IJH21_05865 [Oscillospiraceae bacterium]|nr:hypothetical protein [Oscillospiraceae bacterium]